MSLRVLENYDATAAQRVLAAASYALDDIPAPTFNQDSLADDVRHVLDELRSRFNIQPADWSSQSVALLENALSDEMTSSILGNTTMQTVANRLGDSGKLSPSSYSISISPQVATRFHERDSNFLTKCMIGAERIMHLETNDNSGLTVKAASLFAKFLPPKGKAPPSWILIDALRSGDTLRATAAFRLSTRYFQIDPDLDPLGFLQLFLSRYGVEFEIGPFFSGLLARDVTVPSSGFKATYLKHATPPNDSRSFMYNETGYIHTYKQFIAGELIEVEDTKIVLSYGVDMKRYRADLLKVSA